jgi:hypothetical protein
MVPSVAATAAIGVALAQGALAASFSVSGQQFKVTARELTGHGFSQYGAYNEGASGKNAVAVSAFKTAEIDKLCQSVVTKIPVLGSITLRLEAGDTAKKQEAVYAERLYIDVADLQADAEFKNIDIGVAAGAISKGPKQKKAEVSQGRANPGGFSQQASEAKLKDVKQTAWATTAGTFRLSGLHMSLKKGDGEGVECY